MAGLKTRIAYASDNGTTYSVPMDASNATAVGNTVDLTSPEAPKRLRPRYLLVTHPTTGRQRKLTIGSPANALWTASTSTTVNLPDFNNLMAPVAYLTRGRIGEKR